MSCPGSSPGSPPRGCLQNSLPRGLWSGSDCMNAFFKSPMAHLNLRDAAVCSTTEMMAVVTVGEYLSKVRRSGSFSPRTHHLDFIVGGSPGNSPGFHRLATVDGITLLMVPASFSWLSTSAGSSMLSAFTAPDASTFVHPSPSATFHRGHSSGLMSHSFTSSPPLLAAKASLTFARDTFGFSLNSVKPAQNRFGPTTSLCFLQFTSSSFCFPSGNSWLLVGAKPCLFPSNLSLRMTDSVALPMTSAETGGAAGWFAPRFCVSASSPPPALMLDDGISGTESLADKGSPADWSSAGWRWWSKSGLRGGGSASSCPFTSSSPSSLGGTCQLEMSLKLRLLPFLPNSIWSSLNHMPPLPLGWHSSPALLRTSTFLLSLRSTNLDLLEKRLCLDGTTAQPFHLFHLLSLEVASYTRTLPLLEWSLGQVLLKLCLPFELHHALCAWWMPLVLPPWFSSIFACLSLPLKFGWQHHICHLLLNCLVYECSCLFAAETVRTRCGWRVCSSQPPPHRRRWSTHHNWMEWPDPPPSSTSPWPILHVVLFFPVAGGFSHR